jgi:hypothetical protein
MRAPSGLAFWAAAKLRWRVYESTLELHPNLVMAHIGIWRRR